MRKLSDQEWSSVKTKPWEKIYYSSDDFFPVNDLTVSNTEKISLSDHELTQINRSSFDEMVDFCHVKKNNVLPIDLFQENQLNYWYFLRHSVYIRHKTVMVEYALLNKISGLIQGEPAITVYANWITESKNFPFSKKINIAKPAPIKKSVIGSLFSARSFLALVFLRGLFTLLALPIFFLYRKRHMVMYDNKYKNNVLSLDGTMTKGDHNIFYLLEKTEEKKNFCYASLIPPPASTISVNEDFKWHYLFNPFRKTWNVDFFLLLAFLNPFTFFKARKLKKRITGIRHLPASTRNEEVLANTISGYAKITTAAMYYQHSAFSFIKTFRPLSITMVGEHNLPMQAITNAASLLKVKTHAIQHGVIHRLHPHYYFCKEDLQKVQLTNTTHVWGNSWKKELLQNNYPENKINISGQLRTDCISIAGKIKRNEIVAGISPEKKIMLYISYPSRSDREVLRKGMINDMMMLAKELEASTELVIKPHPREADLEIFNDFARIHGTSNFKISTQDLFVLLMMSDVVVAYHSTVGVEAIALNKPLVILDYDDSDLVGYIRDQVAFNARNYTDLKHYAKGLLTNTIAPIDKKITTAYSMENNYLADGKRVDELIKFIEAG
ncbi:MAG TPA: CDP-glycerol glycerophosphotransferase family protein [Flavobacteriales bacterium]|nr:CDP-glycerol glycerophosphotransferase family protein [Flavobacteriales bacterium]